MSSSNPTTVAPPVLELSRVVKSFGAVVALRSGSIRVESGSIHALVGENGAGKSTLVKIVAGLYRRDAGEFRLRGEDVDFSTTAQSKEAGVAVIYQEPTLFPDLSVTENVFMGRQPTDRLGRIDRRRMRQEVDSLFRRLGVRIDPDRLAEGLSIADQQIIEIAKAVSLDARLLIMDEPTAALSGVEVERLFAVARSLRDEGRGIVFISHRFDEVFSLCDTITVMRDGSFVSSDPTTAVTEDEIVRRMVGRDVTELFPKQETTIGEPLLEVDGLTSTGVFADVRFTVRSGEIVALAGLVGAGRSEIARAVFGVDGYDSGTVRLRRARLRPDLRGRRGSHLAEGRARAGRCLRSGSAPDGAGGAGARPDRAGAQQQADRRTALHQREDRERPRVQHPAQSRGVLPHRGGLPRRAGRAISLLSEPSARWSAGPPAPAGTPSAAG